MKLIFEVQGYFIYKLTIFNNIVYLKRNDYICIKKIFICDDYNLNRFKCWKYAYIGQFKHSLVWIGHELFNLENNQCYWFPTQQFLTKKKVKKFHEKKKKILSTQDAQVSSTWNNLEDRKFRAFHIHWIVVHNHTIHVQIRTFNCKFSNTRQPTHSTLGFWRGENLLLLFF